MRFHCLVHLLVLIGCLCGGANAVAAAPRPNVVFILADDLGFSDIGCYGGEIETPRLDGLAANGLRFTQFYNTARCWPSRACLLTGYYAQQVNRDPQGTRPKWAALAPEMLKAAGYHSYHAGKWHVDGTILGGGFERSYHVNDHNRFFTPKTHELDDKPLPVVGPEEGYYAATAIASRSVEWLAEHDAKQKGEPFFLYTAFISPHFPLHAPAEDIARYKDRYQAGWEKIRQERFARLKKIGIVGEGLSDPETKLAPSWNLSEKELQDRIGPGEVGYAVPWSDLTPEQQRFQAGKMAIHAAMVYRMDREIGRILDQLKKMGADENTIVFFASDNGASGEQIIRGDGHDKNAPPGSANSYLGLGPGWSTVSNTPFRRHKSWTHEGGVSTPLIVSWPAGIKAKNELRRDPGHLVDILPTIFETAGVATPTTWQGEARPALPGRSLVPSFVKDTGAPHSPIFLKHSGNRGLRAGDWKIVASGDKTPWELYNLASDRIESHNLAAEQPAKLAELAATWKRLDEEYARQGLTGEGQPKAKRGAKRAAN